MTNSILAMVFRLWSSIGPHAKLMSLRRIRMVVQSSGNSYPGNRFHQTFAPLSSISFTSKVDSRSLPFKLECHLKIVREIKRECPTGIGHTGGLKFIRQFERMTARAFCRTIDASLSSVAPAFHSPDSSKILQQPEIIGGGIRTGRKSDT